MKIYIVEIRDKQEFDDYYVKDVDIVDNGFRTKDKAFEFIYGMVANLEKVGYLSVGVDGNEVLVSRVGTFGKMHYKAFVIREIIVL